MTRSAVKTFAEPSADPGMPQLAEALDACVMSAHLRVLTGAELMSVALRRHKPGRRCLIEYTVRRPDGAESVWLGKLRAKGVDRRTCDLHRALCECGFDDRTAAPVAVPRPIGVVDPIGMWLQEKVPGEGIDYAIAHLSPQTYAARIAVAIHALHHAPIRPEREHSPADELAILQDRLTRRLPADLLDTRRITQILEGCARLVAGLEPANQALIHRDFYHDQVLLTPDRVYLLDLDLCSVGDPIVDVGNFAAHLLELAIRRPQAADWLRTAADRLAEAYRGLNFGVSQRSIAVSTTLALARHVQICTEFTDRRPYYSTIVQTVERCLREADG